MTNSLKSPQSGWRRPPPWARVTAGRWRTSSDRPGWGWRTTRQRNNNLNRKLNELPHFNQKLMWCPRLKSEMVHLWLFSLSVQIIECLQEIHLWGDLFRHVKTQQDQHCFRLFRNGTVATVPTARYKLIMFRNEKLFKCSNWDYTHL